MDDRETESLTGAARSRIQVFFYNEQSRMRNSHDFVLVFKLGAKKGLGAQKVSSQSFSEIERQAQVAEQLREQQAVESRKQAEESM